MQAGGRDEDADRAGCRQPAGDGARADARSQSSNSAHTGAWSTHVFLDLGLKVSSGVAFYSVWILLTWRLSGRPQGIEATALDFLQSKLLKKAGHL